MKNLKTVAQTGDNVANFESFVKHMTFETRVGTRHIVFFQSGFTGGIDTFYEGYNEDDAKEAYAKNLVVLEDED